MSTKESTRTPGTEIEKRIEQLKGQIEKAAMQGVLILQRADLFYFTGTVQDAYLYVPLEDEPILFVYRDYDRAVYESPIKRIVPIHNINQLPQLLSDHGHRLKGTLGMEFDVLPVNLYLKYKKLFSQATLADISVGIRTVRAIKSEYEIAILEKAAAFSDQLLQFMKTFLKEGLSEMELASMLEAEARKLGHQGIVRMRLWGNEMFYGHLAAGPSAAIPTFLSSPTGGKGTNPSVGQGPGLRAIQKNEPVFFDYVFAYNGYLMDQTRIYAMGRLPNFLLEGHRAMLDIQHMIQSMACPGISAAYLYDKAIDMASAMGYSDHFMGTGDQRIRFVGHGVGIEMDEYPFIAKGQTMKLEEGMVFALEPKLIFPGVGVVGIENTYQVTDSGLKRFGTFDDEIVFV